MALYHFSVKTISRKQGRSAVAAAAYRSGEKLHNHFDGKTYDFTRKTGIICSEILLPSNAPSKYYDREILWNAVENAEKRNDSRTAREIEMALPRELPQAERNKSVREFVIENIVRQGMCADIAIHAGLDSNNPHAHILLTTRPLESSGFSAKKNRDWDNRSNVNIWREQWEKFCNRALARNGLAARVDHRSYAMQGSNREPTKHLGHSASALERHGIHTDRGNENREIEKRNKERELKKQHQQERDRSR